MLRCNIWIRTGWRRTPGVAQVPEAAIGSVMVNGAMMATNSVIVILIIGLIAGWLAGKLMGGGFGLIGDIVIGVIGASSRGG